jgi:hypothetical protein
MISRDRCEGGVYGVGRFGGDTLTGRITAPAAGIIDRRDR